MKILKKITTVILSVIMIISTLIPAFAAEEQLSNYDFLLSQGYPAEHLDNLTENTLQKMVEMIGTGYVTNVDVKKSTFNDGTGVARGAINEDSMTLEIVTGAICQYDTNKITGVLVSATWEWAANKPVYRGQDGVVVNWDSSIFTYDEDTFYAQDVYRSNADDEWSVFKEHTSLSISKQGGLGFYTDLKALKKYVGGSMLFLLSPTSNMIKGTAYKTTLNIEYAHAPAPLTGLSFSTAGFGVGLSWTLNCDTMADSVNFKFSR